MSSNQTTARQGGFGTLGDLTPAGLDAPAATGRRRPHWLLWLLWLLPLVLLPLLAGLGWWWLHPSSLGETHLVGARDPGCLRLVIASDVSGSMASLTEPRDRAVDQLLAWAPQNLRADDELALISFSDQAAVEIPPTPVSDQPARTGPPAISGGTSLEPLLATIGGLPATRCSTSLLLLGDGQFSDTPTDETTATRQLAAAGIDTFDFLVPGPTQVPANWQSIYPAAPPTFFDGTDPDQTALVFGNHLADLTGQQLHRTTT